MNRFAINTIMGIVLLGMVALITFAGQLTPPPEAFNGINPAASMKSLDEIEPRHAILSLPSVITNPGAYYLVKNMYGVSNIVGISVKCSDVQIDLNGFALIGTNDSKDGIEIVGTNENITVRNGSIRKWGGFGISGKYADDGSVEGVKASRNGKGGILFGDGAMILNCSAFGNGYKSPLPPAYHQPTMSDSDYDGMDDSFEQWIIDADPNDAIVDLATCHPMDDFDGDGASNQQEHDAIPPTDPTMAGGGGNADGDSMEDWFEKIIIDDNPVDTISNVWQVMGSDDYDSDGANNQSEFMADTDPTDNTEYDADMDGLNDPFENIILAHDTTNTLPGHPFYGNINDIWPEQDYDSDGVSNMGEQDADPQTDPTDPNDTPSMTGTQTEYASYTNPPTAPLYEEFDDPTDEPSDDGIRTGGFATIKDCKSRRNRGSGFYSQYGTKIVSCIAAGNLADGIHVSDYGAIYDCLAARNKKDGLTIGSKCMIKNNNCGQNGDFEGNNFSMPEGAGIRILGNGNRIEDNNVCGNAMGIMVDDAFSMQYGTAAGMSGGGNLIIGNSSVDNWGMAFSLSDGDFMGGQMHSTSYQDPMNATNAVTDANNPFSNFSY